MQWIKHRQTEKPTLTLYLFRRKSDFLIFMKIDCSTLPKHLTTRMLCFSKKRLMLQRLKDMLRLMLMMLLQIWKEELIIIERIEEKQ